MVKYIIHFNESVPMNEAYFIELYIGDVKFTSERFNHKKIYQLVRLLEKKFKAENNRSELKFIKNLIP